MSRCIVPLVVFAALVGLAAPGAGAKATTAKPAACWSATLCSSVTSWFHAIQKNDDDVSNQLAGASDLLTAQTEISTSLGQDMALTDQTVTKLQQLGVPNVKNGAKIANAFIEAFVSSKADFSAAQAKAQALPTDDVDAFTAGSADIDTSVSAATDPVTSAFSAINTLDSSGNLIKAFSGQKSCKPYVL